MLEAPDDHVQSHRFPQLPLRARRPLAVSLAGATRLELAPQRSPRSGVPERETRMRVTQLWHWIYNQGAPSFDAMLNISKVLRGKTREPVHVGAAANGLGASLDGRHAEMADSARAGQ